jgi:hypothetical protein
LPPPKEKYELSFDVIACETDSKTRSTKPSSQPGCVSLIVLLWRDSDALIPLLQRFRHCAEIREIIVSAAQPSPNLRERVEKLGAIFIETPEPNRGRQLNAGVLHASADWLLFQHVDTELTSAHVTALASLGSTDAVGGAFYRKFDKRHPRLRWLEGLERWHSRAFGTLYGDQSIFVRREHFLRIGAFASFPLMEDVEFSTRLRRSGKVKLLDPPLRSCPQKQIARGAWTVTLRNLLFLILFRCGVPANRLHSWYYSDNGASPARDRSAGVRRSTRWQKRWEAFRHPIDQEKNRILKKRWDSLPNELKLPNQISGRHLTHCGFILGASYCSFHCTHCYLPKNANRVPIPSLAEIKEQIDANRRFQGPGGGLQITGGDVADAYWRAGRADELVEIIRYAYQAGVVPMLMTHGQTLVEHPEFLRRLVVEGGLRQISVHVDMTQAGRHGFPINWVKSEADLHPVRQAFTDLAWRIRRETGCPLEYALSFTVTERNINDVPEVIRWYLADPKRTYIWRMLSFQPEADTGRTVFSRQPVTPDDVWQKICEGTGFNLDRHFAVFGHPDCNNWYPLLVSEISGRYIAFPPQDKRTRQLFADLLPKLGGISFVKDDAGTTPFRVAGIILQHPTLMLRLALHAMRLAVNGQVPLEFTRALLTGRAHTLGTGIHNFMHATQVANANNDPVVRARLDSCVFKGAVKRNGTWEAVPMCEMNQARWTEIYEERLRDPALLKQPQVFDRSGSEDSESKHRTPNSLP